MLDRAEKQMDLLILGQTLTTDVSPSGGSRALGEVHAGVKREMVQAAGNFAAGILNSQLIRSILLLNYREDTEPPRLAPVPKKAEDVAANATRDKTLLDAGVRMPKAWFFKRHDIPLPQEGEETVGQSTVHSPSTLRSRATAPVLRSSATAEGGEDGQSTVPPSDAAQQSLQPDRGDGSQPPDKLESKTTFVHGLAGENAKALKR